MLEGHLQFNFSDVVLIFKEVNRIALDECVSVFANNLRHYLSCIVFFLSKIIDTNVLSDIASTYFCLVLESG